MEKSAGKCSLAHSWVNVRSNSLSACVFLGSRRRPCSRSDKLSTSLVVEVLVW